MAAKSGDQAGDSGSDGKARNWKAEHRRRYLVVMKSTAN